MALKLKIHPLHGFDLAVSLKRPQNQTGCSCARLLKLPRRMRMEDQNVDNIPIHVRSTCIYPKDRREWQHASVASDGYKASPQSLLLSHHQQLIRGLRKYRLLERWQQKRQRCDSWLRAVFATQTRQESLVSKILKRLKDVLEPVFENLMDATYVDVCVLSTRTSHKKFRFCKHGWKFVAVYP